jgi:hypothetical protein
MSLPYLNDHKEDQQMKGPENPAEDWTRMYVYLIQDYLDQERFVMQSFIFVDVGKEFELPLYRVRFISDEQVKR